MGCCLIERNNTASPYSPWEKGQKFLKESRKFSEQVKYKHPLCLLMKILPPSPFFSSFSPQSSSILMVLFFPNDSQMPNPSPELYRDNFYHLSSNLSWSSQPHLKINIGSIYTFFNALHPHPQSVLNLHSRSLSRAWPFSQELRLQSLKQSLISPIFFLILSYFLGIPISPVSSALVILLPCFFHTQCPKVEIPYFIS